MSAPFCGAFVYLCAVVAALRFFSGAATFQLDIKDFDI